MLNLVNKFSKSEAIKFGWNTTKANLPFLIKVFLIMWLFYILNWILSKFTPRSDVIINLLISLTFWIVQTIIGLGIIKISLEFADKQKAKLSDLYTQYPLFLKYFLGELLSLMIVFFGILLLIIPGIIFAIKLKFVGYLIIDKSVDPVTAIKQSWNITKGQFWNLFLLTLLQLGISILGTLALFIGLLWAFPTNSLTTAYVYRKLSQS